VFDSGAFAARQCDERGQLAEQFDPELAIRGYETDLLYEAANGRACFGPHALSVECVGQGGDLAAIEFGQVRMQAQLRCGRCC